LLNKLWQLVGKHRSPQPQKVKENPPQIICAGPGIVAFLGAVGLKQ